MRVILDECLPRGLKPLLIGHSVRTVRNERWNGIKNGKLLRLIETKFDAFITVDRVLNRIRPGQVIRVPEAEESQD